MTIRSDHYVHVDGGEHITIHVLAFLRTYRCSDVTVGGTVVVSYCDELYDM